MRLRELRALVRGRVPGQLVIQLTDQCNARCPQCEMRVTSKFARSKLEVDAMRRMIDAAAARGISVLSFTGGEPLLYLDEIVELGRHAADVGIRYIRTGTNGYLFAHPDRPGWEARTHETIEKLAGSPIRNFWISIDSAVPEVHERMRGFRGLFEGIARAIPIFHQHGLYPSANLGLNRNLGGDLTWELDAGPDGPTRGYLDEFYHRYRRGLREFYQRVVDLGFTIVNCCYPMSVDPGTGELAAVYAATSSDRIVRFAPSERATLYEALFDTIPEVRSRIRVFSPRATLHTLRRYYSGASRDPGYGCRGGLDFFFVDSKDGHAYPCGYRGSESLGPFEDLDLDTRPRSESCTRCDWECFRDPSELFGPVLELLERPIDLLQRFRHDRTFARLWWDDLRYYRACDLFDGRRPPNTTALAKFDTVEPSLERDWRPATVHA
ncbi:MAG: radical SAM protein [Planctomycetes bacterium]|nr:radical SAM protein [Planctomycetota bacterium]